MCVNQLKIAPSEAWDLDYIEINYLLDKENKADIDTSIMLNYERIENGASKEWLQQKV